MLVIEAALLIEADWVSLVDEVWVTTASESDVYARLQEHRGMSKEEALAWIGSQLPDEERIKHADVVICNSGSLSGLEARIEQLWSRLH